MIPLRDDNPTFGKPVVTMGLIGLNVLVFLIQTLQPPAAQQDFVYRYGYVPAELVRDREGLIRELRQHPIEQLRTDRRGRAMTDFWGRVMVERVALPERQVTAIPAWINIFSCMFLHGGWMHLAGNMLYLWIFGDNVEDRLGKILFIVFYLGTGLVGNLAHTLFDAGVTPLVGASGAISGVMGAYILLYPHANIHTFVPLGFYWTTMRVPAWVFLGIYIVIQNLFPATSGAGGHVAYLAHIGGFVCGMALIKFFPQQRRPAPARVAAYRVMEPWE